MSELSSIFITTSEQTDTINSDVEESDNIYIFDNDDEFIDFIPSPSIYENEVQDIDSLSKCFEQRYNNYLMFFMGSLKDACQATFSPTIIQERRPILVYIYHDDNQFRKKFYETIFYSSTIINYLNVNYIVWPYEITTKSNRYTLTKIWEETFSTQFFDNFSIEQCPLLIGIMRLFEHKIDGNVTSEYQFKSLVKSNSLTRTQMTVNRENLLNELDIFKEECDKNEQDLSFSFVKKTGLCWKIILEISQYLSLNDAISAFSIDILSLLNNYQSKFQLSNPFNPFIKMIFRKIKSEQIVSLAFTTSQLWLDTELTFLSNFNKVTSIILHNSSYTNQISEYINCFPNLTHLSLYYDDKINYYILNEVLIQVRQQIKRFEIHCPEIVYTDDDGIDQLKKRQMVTARIKFFLLDVGRYPSTSTNSHLQHYKSWFFMPLADLMKKMPNIQHIHIISNKYNIEYFFDDDQWKLVLNRCSQLKKITLQVL
ncbi:unnamed protein product, partial [Rotaria sp. Silwood1]